MSDFGHGFVGRREQAFTQLLPLRAAGYAPQDLLALSEQMKAGLDDVKDGPDPEENLLCPAGYTYFGQFIDHDLTFDSSSSLNPSNPAAPTNKRTPRFDLDCVYGDGPDAQPYLYDTDGATLLYKNQPTSGGGDHAPADQDLSRNKNGRAIIGDKRNDENSIVCQIQLGFIKYHNAVVATLKKHPSKWTVQDNLFASARNEVRWTYQRLVIQDFLRRIVRSEVLVGLDGLDADQRARNYALYTEDKRGNLPREFVAAAYRFGHSGVRTGYRMNKGQNNLFKIFAGSDQAETKTSGATTLLGFDPLPNNQVIDDWARFFPATLPIAFADSDSATDEDRKTPAGEAKVGMPPRLQFAYKQDPTLVDPLGALPRKQVAGEATTEEAIKAIDPKALPDTKGKPTRPSLALLNLLRGSDYRIQSGQAVCAALRSAGLPAEPVAPEALVVRVATDAEGIFKFQSIPDALKPDTPLWYYVLAEAQEPLYQALKTHVGGNGEFDEKLMLRGPGARTQLGWVGGRIVAEVFYGLLDSDPESVAWAPNGWAPMLHDKDPLVVKSLLEFANKA